MPKSFDAIIIGTGQSGPSLASRLASAGRSVAIIERGQFGGTCVNTGCIPTKAMVASARAAHMARRAGDFGVTVGGAVRVDMRRVMERKNDISGQSRKGVEKMLTGLEKCSVYRAHARFVSDYEIDVGGELLAADQIFIDVGGRADTPSIPGLNDIPYLTNSSLLQMDSLPEHLVILGGSYIGLEFGQMFRRFGSEVTILERGPRLSGREDEDVSKGIKQILEGEGVKAHLNFSDMSVAKTAEGIEVKGSGTTVVGSHLLVATGRRPNTDDLGIENTSLKLDRKRYFEVNDELETSVPGIWAMGDCNGRGAFTHTSYNDYEIIAANLLDNGRRKVSDRITAYNVYIDPPLGRAGMTEIEARKSGRKILIGKREMSKVGRAVEKGETQGFMKVIVDADTKQILGANILGTDGDEAIHCFLDTMYAKAPYTVLQRAVHIHPTVSELIPTMLGNLQPQSDGENQ